MKINKYPRSTTSIVIDPPRKGCSIEFLNQLMEYHPHRIVYLSCDPITQARDVQILLANETYQLIYVQPFDLFPQTRHIECLMILESKII